jgi:hypothetical protein
VNNNKNNIVNFALQDFPPLLQYELELHRLSGPLVPLFETSTGWLGNVMVFKLSVSTSFVEVTPVFTSFGFPSDASTF